LAAHRSGAFHANHSFLRKAISFSPLSCRHRDKAIYTLLQKKFEIFKEQIISPAVLAENYMRPSDKNHMMTEKDRTVPAIPNGALFAGNE
jgi:hypothetical protein